MADARTKSASSSRRAAPSQFAAFEPFLRMYGTTTRVLEAARDLAFVAEDLSQPADSPQAYGAVLDQTDLLLGRLRRAAT